MKQRINPLGKCTKREFDTEQEVKKALKAARRCGVKAFYKCSKCGKYHMTSMRKNKPGVRVDES